MHRAGGEVKKVVDDEEEEDRSAPAHGARSVGGLAPRLLAIADGPGGGGGQGERGRGPDVEDDRDEEHRPRDPERCAMADLAQEDAVVVDRFGTQVHLEVPDHVAHDESEEDDAGRGHHHLLADRGPEETRLNRRYRQCNLLAERQLRPVWATGRRSLARGLGGGKQFALLGCGGISRRFSGRVAACWGRTERDRVAPGVVHRRDIAYRYNALITPQVAGSTGPRSAMISK